MGFLSASNSNKSQDGLAAVQWPLLEIEVKNEIVSYLLLWDPKHGCRGLTGFANFIDEWSQCDSYFTNLRVILE